jgi:hypothetical protein
MWIITKNPSHEQGNNMILYVFAAIASVVMTFFLTYWTLYGVERQYPEPVLKQMIAGCWFFGIMTLVCLLAAPLINIVEVRHGTAPEVQVEGKHADHKETKP